MSNLKAVSLVEATLVSQFLGNIVNSYPIANVELRFGLIDGISIKYMSSNPQESQMIQEGFKTLNQEEADILNWFSSQVKQLSHTAGVRQMRVESIIISYTKDEPQSANVGIVMSPFPLMSSSS